MRWQDADSDASTGHALRGQARAQREMGGQSAGGAGPEAQAEAGTQGHPKLDVRPRVGGRELPWVVAGGWGQSRGEGQSVRCLTVRCLTGCDTFLGRLAGSPVPGVVASEQAGRPWGLVTYCC